MTAQTGDRFVRHHYGRIVLSLDDDSEAQHRRADGMARSADAEATFDLSGGASRTDQAVDDFGDLLHSAAVVVRIARSIDGKADLASTLWLSATRSLAMVVRSFGLIDLLEVDATLLPRFVEELVGEPSTTGAPHAVGQLSERVVVVRVGSADRDCLVLSSRRGRWDASIDSLPSDTVATLVRRWFGQAMPFS